MAEQRYRVVERLAAGGMAEVFVGDAMSVQGFKKRVAIKRVLPHLASNENFIGMFLDEARLGARMNHANIVSVLDIGAADNTYFIVMEYVDGANLKTIIEVLQKQGRPVPMKEAVYIAMEASRGLSYAHELCDEDGNDLDIVHRDISPPNILISKRGEVKVTDFGLAKASTQLEKTDPGVVKGKFSYLAPEAAVGDPVDERADLFALGIVLWEMIAGRRLFLGESDYQTVKLVQQAHVPSLAAINPDADESLERLLAKALAKNPADRYQTAREMSDALAGFLFSHQLKVTSYDIAALVKNAVENEDKPRSAAGQQSIIDKLIQEELVRFTSLGGDGGGAGAAIDFDAGEDVGAQPLDAGSFEDPSSWFSDDGDGGGFGFGDGNESGGGAQQPGWREAGVEDGIAKLESQTLNLDAAGGGSAASAPRTPTRGASQGVASGAGTGTPGTPTGNAAPAGAGAATGTPTAGTSGGAGKWMVVALIVLAVGGAAAFILTQS
ncbi:MAG: serine/threonine protein kinase [Sandaracinaceae bacterium]|nr:serine/threonine protein kinase [Sandaracinaceae bacterium]